MISQIFLSGIKEDIPPFIQMCVESVKQSHPWSQHTIYDNKMLREFIQNNFDSDVLWAYDKLIPYTYKADLGKFCLIYKLGGWYYDIGVQVINQLSPPDFVKAIFYSIEEEMQNLTPQAIQATLFYSKENNPVLENAINIIVDNCKKEYYGLTPFCPTGPNVLGRAVAKYYAEYGVEREVVYGKLRRLTNDCPNKNACFVLPDGTIHALIKPSGKTLQELGAKGTNSYTEMWNNRKIYNDIQCTS